MKALTFFISFILINGLYAQREYTTNQHLYCWAKGGINLRKSPSKNSRKIVNIPFESLVIVMDSIKMNSYTDTLKKDRIPVTINGNWIKIKYGEYVGYAFDGYLSKLKPQSLYEYFEDIKPTIDSSGKVPYTEVYTRKNGAYYKYIEEDGCFDHIYFIPDISFEEAIFLLRATVNSDEEECPFCLEEIRNGEYFFCGCTLTTLSTIKKTKGGYLFHTADCT